MTRVFLIYDTKYGNTKIAAEKIAEGLREVEGTETAIDYVKNINLNELANYDALVIGAPNHMGKPSRTIMKFIDQLAKTRLKSKRIAVFDTYFKHERNYGKAMRKMEKTITDNHVERCDLSKKQKAFRNKFKNDQREYKSSAQR